jgi:hypothetical protein
MNWNFEPGEEIDLDEDDVRVRPNPKGSRPRTKRRPDTAKLPTGMVLQVHLARYRVLMDDGTEVMATLAKELRSEGCVTCDRVAVSGDVSGEKMHWLESCALNLEPPLLHVQVRRASRNKPLLLMPIN